MPPTTRRTWYDGDEEVALLWGDEIPIGKFFQRTDRPSLEQGEPILDEGGPLVDRPLRIAPEATRNFITELM